MGPSQQRCSHTNGASQARTRRSALGHDSAAPAGGQTVGIETLPVPRAVACSAADGVGVAAGGAGRAAGAAGVWPACQQKLNAKHTNVQCRRIARSPLTWKSAQPSSSLTWL